ncbi:MAG TPA: CapA family protein [Kofleriaceae bacterium]|nr:CapA family protein [Kofleriaceae bacterium]
MYAIVVGLGYSQVARRSLPLLGCLLLLGLVPSAYADSGAERSKASKSARGSGDPDTITINFAGDLAYPVGWGGWDYVEAQKHLLYRQIQPILDSAELNFVNVECPLTDHEATAVKQYSIRCKPQQIPYFVDAGFNLLSLANNHSIDAGKAGILDTHAHLARASSPERPLWWAGTGDTSDDARKPVRIALPGKRQVVTLFAVANSSGGGGVGGLHDKTLPARITEAAKHADIVIVSAHHGPEYEHKPWPWTVDRYHELIDAGATLVVGHHAHVVQGVERYKQGLIFYNQGNFSFASRTRRHLEKGARLYSTIGRVTFRKGALDRVEIIPLYASNQAKWTLEGMTLPPRHAEPQLLAGPFAQFALDEFVDFAKQVPKAQETSFIRIGDRMFVDLGETSFSPAEQKSLLAQQKREYSAVIKAGVAPQPATEAEMRVKQRAGTPWPWTPPAPEPKKKQGKKAGKQDRGSTWKAGKRGPSRPTKR